MSNIIDAAIAYVAPSYGRKRLRARAAYDLATRLYSGAAAGRHTDAWVTQPTSADAEVSIGSRRLRDRARDLVRNNPHAEKAMSILANNIVGEGIMPRASYKGRGADKKNARVDDAFKAWLKECDADGQLDFYGLQTLAVRTMVESGEVLLRRRQRRASDGLSVPLQLQMFEPDYLDDRKIGLLENGNKAINGIEFDQIGRRAAYWMYNEHPGNNFLFNMGIGLQSRPVPASEIVHLYEKKRTQARGASWFAPVIRRQRDIDDYDFAEGIRKKIEASTVAFVIGDDEFEEGLNPDKDTASGARVTDGRGNLLEKIAPGLIAYLRGGKDVKFNQPAANGGYEEYKRVAAREVAAGLRIPYELLTGDLSSVNFSSARVGIVEFRRFCSVMQNQVVIPMLLNPIWAWFCEAAWAAGLIDEPLAPVEWAPPKWQAIEPYKDALAELITLRSGTRSYHDIAAQYGRNPDDVVKEIAAWNTLMDQLGVTLDSDPRKTTMKGLLQKFIPDGQSVEPAGGASADSGFGNSNENF